jgi:hypothetical protein
MQSGLSSRNFTLTVQAKSPSKAAAQVEHDGDAHSRGADADPLGVALIAAIVVAC